tara:strand:+ start:2203 stop:3147 length:945 start_codon:yes stop_codon:yes gene_type:complete
MAAKETIEIVGGANTGKTVFLCEMAVANPDQTVYLFDNQMKARRVFQFVAGGVPDNVTILHTPTLQDAKLAVWSDKIPAHIVGGRTNVPGIDAAFHGQPEGTGLVLIDNIDVWWDRSQQHYVSRMSQGEQSLGDHMLETVARKRADQQRRQEAIEKSGNSNQTVGMKGGSEFEGFVEWPVIKQWHNEELVEPLLFDFPCHVIATALVRELRQAGDFFTDSEDRQEMWGALRVVPLGEKGNDGRFNTILYIERQGLEEVTYRLSCVKDMARALGKPAKLFLRKTLAADDAGVFSVWDEYRSQQPGTPAKFEADVY